MRKRITYIITTFLALVVLMMLQKPIFLISTAAQELSVSDYFDVMWHGLSLDIPMAGYIISIPILLTVVSIFAERVPIRAILSVWYCIAAFTISATFFGDLALYPFWLFKLDASVLFYLQSPKGAAASVSIWFIIAKLIEVVIYTVAIAALLIWITPKKFGECKHKVWSAAVGILGIGLTFVAIRGGVGKSSTNIGRAYYCNDQYLNHAAVNPTFSFMASLGKTEKFEDQFQFIDAEECATKFAELFPAKTQVEEGTDTLLRVKRPNVMIVMCEGYGAEFIESLGGAKGLTPHTDSLICNSLSFDNCYGNSYRTDRATISLFGGHLSYPTTSLMKMPAKSKSLPSIAHSLAREGYSTHYIYGGDINFANKKSYLLSSGFDNFVSDADFSPGERHTHAWGVTDHIMFNRATSIVKSGELQQPWFVAVQTLAHHEPFEVPYNRIKNDIMGNSAAYFDESLGGFIASLEADKSVWDNLIVVIVADHGIHYPAGEPRSNPKYFRIPLIFTGGALAVEPTRIEYTIEQSDIAATLLSMLGVDHSDFPFSRNVLSKEYRDGFHFAYYTFINGYGFVTDSAKVVVDNESNRTIYATDSVEADRLADYGRTILQYSYRDLGAR